MDPTRPQIPSKLRRDSLRLIVIIIEGYFDKCFMNPEVASNVKAILGEGPDWDAKNEILYWIDIRGGAIFAHKLRNPNDQVVAKAELVSSLQYPGEGWTCPNSAARFLHAGYRFY